jgi:hypothetical protein
MDTFGEYEDILGLIVKGLVVICTILGLSVGVVIGCCGVLGCAAVYYCCIHKNNTVNKDHTETNTDYTDTTGTTIELSEISVDEINLQGNTFTPAEAV